MGCCAQALGEFIESGYLQSGQAELVREAVRRQLRAVRPDAVALCDAWGHSDHAPLRVAEVGNGQGSKIGRTPEADLEGLLRNTGGRPEPAAIHGRHRPLRTCAIAGAQLDNRPARRARVRGVVRLRAARREPDERGGS